MQLSSWFGGLCCRPGNLRREAWCEHDGNPANVRRCLSAHEKDGDDGDCPPEQDFRDYLARPQLLRQEPVQSPRAFAAPQATPRGLQPVAYTDDQAKNQAPAPPFRKPPGPWAHAHSPGVQDIPGGLRGDRDYAGIGPQLPSGFNAWTLPTWIAVFLIVVFLVYGVFANAASLQHLFAHVGRISGRPPGLPRAGELRPMKPDNVFTTVIPASAALPPAFYQSLSLGSCNLDAVGLPSGSTFWGQYMQAHRSAREQIVRQGAVGAQRVLIWRCLDDDFCAGLGDQARGLASALYVAMLTNRTLFIQWRRHGKDVLANFGPHTIDWHVPAVLLQGTCGAATWIRDGTQGALLATAKQETQCLVVTTNQEPDVELARLGNEVCGKFPQLNLLGLVGCAMNFLFSYDSFYEALAANSHLTFNRAPARASVEQLVQRYVAVHLRFGDAVFQGTDTPDMSMIADALQCALNAGQELFGPGAEDWAIFFASDSAVAHTLALQYDLGVPVFVSSEAPVHTQFNHEFGNKPFWGLWSDLLLLARARGLVQCMDLDRNCSTSGYSQLAAQVSLMPQENIWVAMKSRCARTGDVSMNAWFDRGEEYTGCPAYVTFLEQALALGGYPSSPSQQRAIAQQVEYRAMHA